MDKNARMIARAYAEPPARISRIIAAQKPPPTESSRMLKDAVAMLRERKYDKAEVSLAILMSENHRDSAVVGNTITLYGETGSLDLAKGLFNRAKQGGYATPFVYYSMIRQYARKGMVIQGSNLLNEAIEAGLDASKSYCEMIGCYGRMKLREQALEVFQLARSRDCHSQDVYSAMTLAYLEFRMTDKAKETFYESIERGISNPALFKPILRSLALHGRISEATDLLKKAHEMSACDAHTCRSLLQAGIQAEKFHQSRSVFNFALKEGFCDGILCGMMLTAYSEESKNARGIFEIAESRGFADSKIYSQMIDIHVHHSEAADAAELFSRGLGKGYVSHATFEIVSTALYSEDRFTELLKLIDSLPGDFASNHYVLIRKAETLRKLRRYDEAIDHLRDVIRHNNLSYSRKNLAHIIMAFSLKDGGRLKEAHAAFKTLMSTVRPSDFRYARVACGMVFVWQDSGFKDEYLPKDARVHLLERLVHFQKRSRGNLYTDVQKAIRLLERRATSG